MNRSYLFIVALLVANLEGFAQTTIPGGDVFGTWETSGSPYFIEGDINVPAGKTLVIDSGSCIEFRGHYAFSVSGIIKATGTETAPVQFVSPGAIGWRGIRVNTDTLVNDSIFFRYCIFRDGVASFSFPDNCGGAISIQYFDKVAIEHCYFEGNNALIGLFPLGGALALQGFSGIVRNNVFVNNAGGNGGAIFFYYSDPTVSNNLFYYNYSPHKGGAICLIHSSPILVNNTIAYNQSAVYGGGIEMNQMCNPLLMNNILWGNTAVHGQQLFITDDSCIPDFYNNDIQDGQDSIAGYPFQSQWSDNIAMAPLFVNSCEGNFSLDPQSPCIDAGMDTIFDPDGTVSDIGAYYYDQLGTGFKMPRPKAAEAHLEVCPNPFAGDCLIMYSVPGEPPATFRIAIYDLAGREVSVLMKASGSRGAHLMNYNASDLVDGIYILQLNAGGTTLTKKLIKLHRQH